jgi:hypothetical protein
MVARAQVFECCLFWVCYRGDKTVRRSKPQSQLGFSKHGIWKHVEDRFRRLVSF